MLYKAIYNDNENHGLYGRDFRLSNSSYRSLSDYKVGDYNSDKFKFRCPTLSNSLKIVDINWDFALMHMHHKDSSGIDRDVYVFPSIEFALDYVKMCVVGDIICEDIYMTDIFTNKGKYSVVVS